MIGLIVDGEGDYAAFRARYIGRARVYRADGPRGHLVTESSIIDSARRQIGQLRQLGCTRIAIVTDFEGRQGAASGFKESCLAYARRNNFSEDVMIFVADRMLENWFLADIAFISSQRNYLRTVRRQRSYESTSGKSELKSIFERGYDYNEIRHGQDIFPLVRGEQAARYSSSFAEFRDELGLD